MLTRFARFALVVLLLAPITASAQSFAKPPAVAPNQQAQQHDDAAPTREDVRAALVARRAHNLESFEAYMNAGVYPHNTERTGPLNVWRDAKGHICAAATMIFRDGHADLVNATAQTTNHIRLLDVTSGPLMDWILASGFSLEEIDQIQAPAPMPAARPTETDYKVVDAKLHAHYVAVLSSILEGEHEGLDTATDRLMEHPELAKKLVDSTRPKVVARR